jgi:hypothetical protein
MTEPKDNPIRLRKITWTRIVLAVLVGLVADGLQLVLGPLAWTPIDAVIDVVTGILVTWLIGFHWLFLPTFVIEAVPVVDDFPTWTACVVAVVALRRRVQPPPPIVREKVPGEN